MGPAPPCTSRCRVRPLKATTRRSSPAPRGGGRAYGLPATQGAWSLLLRCRLTRLERGHRRGPRVPPWDLGRGGGAPHVPPAVSLPAGSAGVAAASQPACVLCSGLASAMSTRPGPARSHQSCPRTSFNGREKPMFSFFPGSYETFYRTTGARFEVYFLVLRLPKRTWAGQQAETRTGERRRRAEGGRASPATGPRGSQHRRLCPRALVKPSVGKCAR